MFSSLSLPFYTWRLALLDIKPRNSLFPLSIFDIMGHYPNVIIIWFLFLLKFCLDTNESSSWKSSQFTWIYFGASSELVFSDIYRDLCPLSMYSFLSFIYLKAKPSFVTSVFDICSILNYVNDLCHLFTCLCSHGPINSPRTGAVFIFVFPQRDLWRDLDKYLLNKCTHYLTKIT